MTDIIDPVPDPDPGSVPDPGSGIGSDSVAGPSGSGTKDDGGVKTGGVLFAMCLALVLVTASMSSLYLALPDLAVDLGASTASLTWIVDGYVLALAGLVLPFGALGDRLGRRAVLLAGAVVLGAAALAASEASGTTALIAWRAVMGLGAAMIMPGTLSTITAVLPDAQRQKGIAVWSACAAVGVILGMLATGVLLHWFNWRSIFVSGAVAALGVALAAVFLAPETKGGERHRFDVAGALCTALAPAGLVYALIEGNDAGWGRPTVLAALAVTVVVGIAYVVLGLRTEHPLLDPRLFRNRGFRAGAVTIAVQFMAVFGFFFVGLQYLQLVLGYSPLKSALALVPVAVVVAVVSEVTPRLTMRLGMRTVMMGGLLLLGTGLFTLSLIDVDSGYPPFLGSLVLAGLGIGLTGVVGTSAITGSLPREQQGVASAMNDVTREAGAAIGIALMGSLFGSHYRSSLPDLSGLPEPAAEVVRHSAVGGLEVADRLGPQGVVLATDVKEALVTGMSVALGSIAAITAVAACLLVRTPQQPASPE
ncbi:MFS transporter [Streptomyces longispororuber]|uniref:MFS transporter n=1 Tax=Streptomyces longispororuber TaxID=68230 RepID=A0A918Z9J5_9ACTN|nr:MFS transporter [Streptomyces longispororuber]GHE41447.1 MFS transporter [Streptomyces longispororuber]